jgi:hypothetical protein
MHSGVNTPTAHYNLLTQQKSPFHLENWAIFFLKPMLMSAQDGSILHHYMVKLVRKQAMAEKGSWYSL